MTGTDLLAALLAAGFLGFVGGFVTGVVAVSGERKR